MKKELLITAALLSGLAAPALAENREVTPADTVRLVDMEEVVVIATPKENAKLRELPTAVSLLTPQMMKDNQVNSLKGASALVPNFFMPDYGSSLTSAIYIRGIGSRINTPAVGLYVDNVAYLDKSAFDFNFYDIERIDILRGPQGTLYGRNTMGGLVKVHTRSPFDHQGTEVKLGYATRNNGRQASLTHYHRISDRFAFSAGGYYDGADGFFTNAYNGQKMDSKESGGGRIRAIWLPGHHWKSDLSVSYDYTDEGGYPYYNMGATADDASRGTLSYNRESSYRRSMLNASLNLSWQNEHLMLNSATGYQYLDDRMFLDQDFTPSDIYTLEQTQRLNTWSEELTLKRKPGHTWQWLVGTFGFYQSNHTTGPVNFLSDGMTFLNRSINSVFPDLSAQGMSMSLALKGDEMNIPSHFRTPVTNGALFHQSTFTLGRWELTAGLRLDYEHLTMDYRSSTAALYDFTLSSSRMPITLTDRSVASALDGSLSHDYTQLLPKLALSYKLGAGSNVYASVSKGYRSGGYNVQMFSDLTQTALQNTLKQDIQAGVNEKLQQYVQMGMPESVTGMISGMMGQYLTTTDIDVNASTTYRPEYSWNYEAGTHLSLLEGKLQADAALFLMDTRDQQIAKFVNSGLGRITVNAGKSRSYGGELNLIARPDSHWTLNGSYGYTHSTFREYDGGITSKDVQIDYSGNYVPYVPRHTVNVGAAYRLGLSKTEADHALTFGLNYTGAGKIYWTESNTALAGNSAAQGFYGTLNAHVTWQRKAIEVDLWGHNLTDAKYHTFYFESMSRGFAQKGKPVQFGVDLRLHL
jgi:outer membrane receptor protein involved in Fe transport